MNIRSIFVSAVAAFTLNAPAIAQADFETTLTRLGEKIAEAGAMCIASSLAIQDIAREIGHTELQGTRQGIANSVERLAADQDHLDEQGILLRAIHWRDTFFKPAARVAIPAYVAGEEEPESALYVMREGQNQCQEWHRLKNMRAMEIARHEASQ